MTDPLLEARLHALTHAHERSSSRARDLERTLRRLLRAFDRVGDCTDQAEACDGATHRPALCDDCAADMDREMQDFMHALQQARDLLTPGAS